MTHHLESPQWAEISILLPATAHEAMSGFLFDLGCEGLVTEGDRLKGYLPVPQELEPVRQRVLLFVEEMREIFPEIGPPDVLLLPIENSDWSENWRRFFHPEIVTPRLCVAPPWETPPQDWKGELILMDPGPAFGTGQHATTRMCLRALERAGLSPRRSLLDVGTGSGILAIYGAKLGAGRILAVDTDPEALRWAERNIRINGLSGRVELTGRAVETLEERFSVIAANLTVDVILDLIPSLLRLMESGGTLILSGLLREQVERTRSRLRQEGLPMGKTYYRGEWASVVTGRRNR
jgi:ribosomal protein L11 methyltransferase